MSAKIEKPYILRLGGREISLKIRRSRRAHRIALRLDSASGGFDLVLPRGASLAQAIGFAKVKEAWILDRLSGLPPRVAFRDGACISVLGETHVIRHEPGERGRTHRAASAIRVSGPTSDIDRRVRGYLKAEARRILTERAREKAARIGRTVTALAVRDSRTRWGSCSTAGRLNFSWRLILAPEAVLDYVVAHEVAHLAEMNHGPRFWRLVAILTPAVAEPRRWLAQNGTRLLRCG